MPLIAAVCTSIGLDNLLCTEFYLFNFLFKLIGSPLYEISNPQRSASPDIVIVESDNESTESPVASTSRASIINKINGNLRLVSSTTNQLVPTLVVDDILHDNDCIKQMTQEELSKAIKKIRYLSMTPQEFAEGPARSKYLTHYEALTILILITCPSNTEFVMPEGFCLSRSRRNRFLANRTTIQTQMTQKLNKYIYCMRAKCQEYEFHNANVSDSTLTFQVDRNIWITGIKVPTQLVPPNTGRPVYDYTEIIYVHVQHLRGSRIRYVHLTVRVDYGKIEVINFDRPVYIHANQIYKIFVTFHKKGKYPVYSCLTETVCNEVNFKFNIGCSSESVRDGLIHGILFQTAESNQ